MCKRCETKTDPTSSKEIVLIFEECDDAIVDEGRLLHCGQERSVLVAQNVGRKDRGNVVKRHLVEGRIRNNCRCEIGE
jgi:hypothetical protein